MRGACQGDEKGALKRPPGIGLRGPSLVAASAEPHAVLKTRHPDIQARGQAAAPRLWAHVTVPKLLGASQGVTDAPCCHRHLTLRLRSDLPHAAVDGTRGGAAPRKGLARAPGGCITRYVNKIRNSLFLTLAPSRSSPRGLQKNVCAWFSYLLPQRDTLTGRRERRSRNQ